MRRIRIPHYNFLRRASLRTSSEDLIKFKTKSKGSEEDLSHLVLLDVQTGDVERIESDPENEVDFESPVFSARTDELVATTYVGDRLRVYFKNTVKAMVMAMATVTKMAMPTKTPTMKAMVMD